MPADGMWLPLKKEFGTSHGGSYVQASVSTLEMKRGGMSLLGPQRRGLPQLGLEQPHAAASQLKTD
jgi:hypothetical protein